MQEGWNSVLTLGIDTATRVCSVALCDGPKVLGALDINVGLTHSEGLVPQLETLLKLTKKQRQDLELIAISRGPGSFTGLRIGMATAEALAYSLDIPLVGVDTLQVMACNLPVPGVQLVPVLDAQKGNVYVGRYVWQDDRPVSVKDVEILAVKDLPGILEQEERPSVILGECRKISLEGCQKVSLVPEYARLPKAASVAILGAESYTPGNKHSYFGMDPFYIRRSEAEELWEKRHNASSAH